MKVNSQLKAFCPICKSKSIFYWGSAFDIGNPSIKHDIAKCYACTHLFVHPLPSVEYLYKAYKISDPSVYADNGSLESRSINPFSLGDNWVWKHITAFISPKRILDIGSANITQLERIVKLGWELTIVEPGAHAERIKKMLQCSVYRGLFEEINFNNKFEIISAIDVLEHVHSPVHFLKTVKSFLSENGIALFRFPNSGSLRCKLEEETWEMLRPLGHLHYFSPRSIRRACYLSNLKIIALHSHDLRNYLSVNIGKIRIPQSKFLYPFFKVLDLALLGDQLLMKVTHA